MANLKTVSKKSKAQSMGMHTEVLTGRTQQKFFNPDEAENFYYFGTYDVDFNKRTELDVKDMTAPEANKEIDNLMSQGYGTIVIKNPQGKHSLGVGILNKLNLIFEGSLGYFGMGSCDGPIVRINRSLSCRKNERWCNFRRRHESIFNWFRRCFYLFCSHKRLSRNG